MCAECRALRSTTCAYAALISDSSSFCTKSLLETSSKIVKIQYLVSCGICAGNCAFLWFGLYFTVMRKSECPYINKTVYNFVHFLMHVSLPTNMCQCKDEYSNCSHLAHLIFHFPEALNKLL